MEDFDIYEQVEDLKEENYKLKNKVIYLISANLAATLVAVLLASYTIYSLTEKNILEDEQRIQRMDLERMHMMDVKEINFNIRELESIIKDAELEGRQNQLIK